LKVDGVEELQWQCTVHGGRKVEGAYRNIMKKYGSKIREMEMHV